MLYSKSISILIVEDDELERMALQSMLSNRFHLDFASDKKTAYQLLANKKYDLGFFDLHLTDGPACPELLILAKEKIPYFAVLSGSEDEAHISMAYQLGCKDYLNKPASREKVELVLQKFFSQKNDECFRHFFEKNFITKDTQIIQDIFSIRNLQGSALPIFLSGPSGVGKTAVAKFIHQYFHGSSDEKFVHLNCSEIPDNLLESELFGYEKGAFTGATERKKGKLELAHEGTLFLDEVATMPVGLQKKLLRVLEEKDFYPLGSSKKVTSNFRLIAATWEDLEELVKQQQFRLDLYYRIQGLKIHLKPLIQRKDDINLLIKHFLKKSPRRVILSSDAMNALENYSWPGNVRELSRVIELISTKASGSVDLSDLPEAIVGEKVCKKESRQNLVSNEMWELSKYKGLPEAISLLEEEVVKWTINKNQGKVRLSLRELKISNSSFYKIMQRLKLNKEKELG